MIDPREGRSAIEIIGWARSCDWAPRWMERLLSLRRDIDGETYLVQVLFKDNGWYDYALAWHRRGYFHGFDFIGSESETVTIKFRRDLFKHLEKPA